MDHNQLRVEAFEPNLVSLITTFQCPLSCEHCSIESSPHRTHGMEWADLSRYVRQAATVPSVRTVVFTGGEPFLLGDRLVGAVKLAGSLGLRTRVVTSAFWAKTSARAEDVLRPLVEAGLCEFNVSYDRYHVPWVAPDTVHNALKTAVGFSLPSVVSVQVSASRFLDRVTLERELRLEEIDTSAAKVLILFGAAVPVGRGKHMLAESEWLSVEDLVADRQAVGCGGCRSALRQIAVFPGGDVLICCTEYESELRMGNLNRDCLTRILNAGCEDVFFNLLAIEGPYGIMRGVKKAMPGADFRDNYVNQCHVCNELRTKESLREGVRSYLRARAGTVALERKVWTRIQRKLPAVG